MCVVHATSWLGTEQCSNRYRNLTARDFHATCRRNRPRRPYDLYCVGGDVKPCSNKSRNRRQKNGIDLWRRFLSSADLWTGVLRITWRL